MNKGEHKKRKREGGYREGRKYKDGKKCGELEVAPLEMTGNEDEFALHRGRENHLIFE